MAEARTLYRLLLEPVALLRQNSRLIIVPDGKLNMAALGASIDPNGRFAIETHVISYSPSRDCVLPVVGTEAVAKANRNVGRWRCLLHFAAVRRSAAVRYASAVCLVL